MILAPVLSMNSTICFEDESRTKANTEISTSRNFSTIYDPTKPVAPVTNHVDG